MSRITEDNLQFTFTGVSQVVKYDDSQWKHQRFGHFPALDILVRQKQQQWWIEIKDCIGAEADNLPRLAPAESEAVIRTRDWIKKEGWQQAVRVSRKKPFIIDELIEKLRSTLVGCTLAELHADTEVGPFQPQGHDAPVFVVLYLTWNPAEFGRLARSLQTKLDKALKPFGWQGLIVNNAQQLNHTGINCSVTRI